MTQNIYLLAFGTFGNPYGFRQTFYLGNQNVAKSIKTFDLSTNAIKLFENSILYSIRKESINGLNAIAYSKYSFAKERNSDRGGTFVGASILFTNEIAEDNLTISKLNEFHEILVRKNIEDKTIMVNHSDDFTVDMPKDFDKLSFHLKNIDEPSNFRFSNSNLVVYSHIDENSLQQNLKKSLELLNNFDTIFFTNDEEVANFTIAKSLYKTIDEKGFDTEIQIVREEKKKQRQIILHDFEKEYSELEENKKKSIRLLKDSIEQNIKLHQENNKRIEDSKKQVTIVENKYAEFSKKIKEAINDIQSDKNMEEIKRFHNENKLEFINDINENTRTQNLNSLQDTHSRTGSAVRNHPAPDWLENNNEFQKRDRKEKTSSGTFKFLTILFFLLWVLTFLYFLFLDEINELFLGL